MLRGEPSEERGDPAGERMTADGCRGRPDYGDADLDGCEEALGVLAQSEDGSSTPASLVCKLPQPGLTERDDGDLGAREERVREDESQDD